MEQYIQTALGILVSVSLFVIGYRQTIGARKERIKTCNEKLIETLLRRIILEKYTPKKADIRRLIEGKARDYKLKPKDLLNEEQILNTIYTRIFENDLISQEQRDENIERLSALFDIEKEESSQDVAAKFLSTNEKNKKSSNYWSLLLGLFSIIVSMLIIYSMQIKSDNVFTNASFWITASGSCIAIIITYLFLKLKDNQESTEDILPHNPFQDNIKFEKEVVNMFQKLNINVLVSKNKDNGFDLIAIIKGEKVAVEIRYWKQRPPLGLIKRVLDRMEISMKKEGLSKGIIITNNKFQVEDRLKFEENIEIVTLNEMKKYFE